MWSPSDSSGVYICNSVVNDLRHGNFICESEMIYLGSLLWVEGNHGRPSAIHSQMVNSSGVYMCKSIVNDLRHGNYICKSEGIYLKHEHRIEIPVEFTYVNQKKMI